MSTYKSIDLFGSGPHRVMEGRHAQALASRLFSQPPQAGTRYLGLVELEVIVRGRLVAATDAALWDLIDDIAAEVIDPPEPGTLEAGREWDDLSFVSFRPADRIDRARAVSVAYEARFLRFREYPQS